MKLERKSGRQELGFSLVEVAVCVAIMSVTLVTLYGGIASGFGLVNLARENLRANQILIEKMETIRLYNWEQINSNGYIPATFTAPFFPAASTNTNNSEGLTYYGSLTIESAPVSSEYATNMRLVTVSLNWTNGHIPRIRELKTLVGKHGLQNYVYY
jgi:prepilin-type N-terminal cleavage/methylation domain-containing protein